MLEQEPVEHRVSGNGIELNILEVGRPTDPCVVMLHGLRDTAWALLPVAAHLSGAHTPAYRVLITELRGHGASQRSDAYGMPNFLLDLYQTIQTLTPAGCALFGHSLGGHVVTKFAALFPELVKALLVVEGLGPPKRPHEGDDELEVAAYRDMLLSRAVPRPSSGKPIVDNADVAARLCRNNPRLTAAAAAHIAPHMVQQIDGKLRWAFDSRASSVFIGTSPADNVRFWRQVQAPTCIVSGTLSYQYWGREMPNPDFSGHFAEGEMEQRVQNFAQHEHHWFENSGHMVHYDEPDRLGALSRQFLEQHYV